MTFDKRFNRHTPGPWSVEDIYAVVHDYADGDTGCIASVQWTGDNAETMANTRLIAAAPELLDALRELVTLAELGDADQDVKGWHPALQAARAVISKAKGE